VESQAGLGLVHNDRWREVEAMSGGAHGGRRDGSSRHVARERVRTGLFPSVSASDDGRGHRGGGLASVACHGRGLMRDSHLGPGPSVERARAGANAGRNRRRPWRHLVVEVVLVLAEMKGGQLETQQVGQWMSSSRRLHPP